MLHYYNLVIKKLDFQRKICLSVEDLVSAGEKKLTLPKEMQYIYTHTRILYMDLAEI